MSHRVAAVTGASRGLGAAFAQVLSGARMEEIVLRSASQTPEY